ncbi:hypothetical protein BH09BAC1_BH09BAC1_09130 [soil metagenome]
MRKFTIIGEGKTDHAVLKSILIGYFNDPDEDKTRFIFDQPAFDETDRKKYSDQENFGGWVKVLQYCASEQFRKGEADYQYIVIQIDTDRAHEKPFDVAYDPDINQYILSLKQRLIKAIGDTFYERIKEKVFFALCIKSLECWLLPIRYVGKDANKMQAINACENLLNDSLKGSPNKDFDTYLKLSKDYRTKKLRQLYDKNPSLRIFIESLDTHFATTNP